MPCAEHRSLEREETPSSPSPEQRNPPLRNKLFIPPLRPDRVSRPRLIQQLQSGLNKSLILVSAPAGYGKTTLVSAWLHEAGIPFAWISLDEGDDDPVRFLQYLVAALQTVLPADAPDLSGMIQNARADGFYPLLNLLIDEIAGSAGSFVLVLDDVHTLQSPPVWGILAYLLERLPPPMHLALLTRTDPPLPLARLRGRGQLVEIRAEVLSFTEPEAAEFLRDGMSLDLAAADIAALEERTEGWIAGLQLAALAVKDRPDPHAAVSAFTGSHYYIIDYLTEEALNRQPEYIRTFLLQTSILSNLCASLCAAVAPLRAPADGDSQAVLETLDRMNMFIIPLDGSRCWYRYHHLFADMLRLRLERQFPQQIPALHRRASEWYEANNDPAEAIRHALNAKDEARAAALIEGNGCSLILSGESYTLLNWVAMVDAYTRTHPWLAILKAWALALTNSPGPVEAALQTAENLIADAELTDEVRIVRGSIATIRAFLANQQGEPVQAEEHARLALKTLPEGDSFSCTLRSVATAVYGDASLINGSLENARLAYVEAVRMAQASHNVYTAIIAQTDLADVLAAQGKLHQAAGIYREILQAAVRPNRQILPFADRALAGLSEITYEWNDLEAATGYTRQLINLCEQWENPTLQAEGHHMLARLEFAQDHQQDALAELFAAERLASDPRLAERQRRHLRLGLAQVCADHGNLSRVEEHLRLALPAAGRDIRDEQEPGKLLRLRLLLANGQHDAALELSDRLLLQAELDGRIGRVIEILVLQAIAFQGKKELAQAQGALDQALALAQPEGFTRVFLDQGAPLARLIYQLSVRGTEHSYASTLLPAFKIEPVESPHPAQNLIEPLTAREIEVLKLIETGCGNQDVAAKLFISIPTVKRHVSNIYAKLGAKNRTQAVSMGRELGLLND